MAIQDEIAVIRLDFPQQTIITKTVDKFRIHSLPVKKCGYIDRRKPHAANHIRVGNLGLKEILLIACDDGDVIGYDVATILRTIESSLPPPEPIFAVNVGASAWGLAIHTQARLIAVSSNTHKINIFSFGLTKDKDHERRQHPGCSLDSRIQQEDHSSDISESQDNFSTQSSSNIAPEMYLHQPLIAKMSRAYAAVKPFFPRTLHEDFLEHRDRNYVSEIVLHTTNVPCIDFWNPESSTGQILLASSDIKGNTWVFDVTEWEPVFHCTIPIMYGSKFQFPSDRGDDRRKSTTYGDCYLTDGRLISVIRGRSSKWHR